MDKCKVREELLHSLHEWGVSGTHKEHVNFRKNVIKKGLEMASSNGEKKVCSFKHLKSVSFPETIHEAYHHVLVNDIEQSPEECEYFEDALGNEYFGEPKFRWWDKRMNPPKVVGYRLKRQYRRFDDSELDPLRRYKIYKTLPKDEYFFDDWFVDSHTDSIMGTFLEAWFACHAIKKEACFNCKTRNSLRWAGGSGSSWQDLVCISCECMYELKTKASMEKIESVFHFNDLLSGSFKGYCMIQNTRRKSQKMFIVILPRQCVLNRRREQYHPVIVSEIKSVQPRLFEENFLPGTGTLTKSFRSRTTMDLKTKRKWFDLPSVESINLQDSMKKAFAQVFGREAYERCLQKSQIDEREDSCEDDSKIGSESAEEKEIANQVKKLTIEQEEVPDSWEDAYDSK